MAIEAPIFPLGVVLFPGMPLILHIFEPRYRSMLARSMEESLPIGIFAIREGSEALGALATPMNIGCLASLHAVQRLPDGRSHIELRGEEKIRLLSVQMQPEGYAMARCEAIQEEVDCDLEPGAIESFQVLLRDLAGDTPPLPDDPLILCHTALRLIDLPVPEKQRLLELDSFQTRWMETLSLLQRKAGFRRMAKQLATTHLESGLSLN